MLNIYTKIPDKLKDKYVVDADGLFDGYWRWTIKHPEFERVINKIEEAKFVSKDLIEGKFGFSRITDISSGTKALLLALYFDEYLINFNEVGNNVFNLALELSKIYNMNILLNRTRSANDMNTNIKLDDKICTVWELYERV